MRERNIYREKGSRRSRGRTEIEGIEEGFRGKPETPIPASLAPTSYPLRPNFHTSHASRRPTDALRSSHRPCRCSADCSALFLMFFNRCAGYLRDNSPQFLAFGSACQEQQLGLRCALLRHTCRLRVSLRASACWRLGAHARAVVFCIRVPPFAPEATQ